MSKSAKHKAVVLFDGVCNLCNHSVNFVIDRDPEGYFKFASLQSDEAKPYIQHCSISDENRESMKVGDVLQSIILVEDGQCYRRSSAILRIARKLKGGWPLLYGFIIVPKPVRNLVYDWIAQNRYKWFGKQETCRIPTPELRSRFLDELKATAY